MIDFCQKKKGKLSAWCGGGSAAGPLLAARALPLCCAAALPVLC
jgi:hypothetical protein